MNAPGSGWAYWLGRACPYCGEKMRIGGRLFPTLDHLTPKSRGGRYELRNLMIVCHACNWDKGNMTLQEYAAALALRGDQRATRVAALLTPARPS